MAEPYDYEKDARPPCEFPVDGEISIDDFNPDGKYKDCKIDWAKEGSRLDDKALHFNVNYDVTKNTKKEVKEEMAQITPELITAPVEPPKVTETIGVPQINLAAQKQEILHKAADPATTAAIAGSIAAVGMNMATAYVMKLPQVQKVLKQINEVLHKVTKGKLGKKEAVEEKKVEEKKEEGSDCKSIHFQTKVALTALKSQVATMEARISESKQEPISFDSDEIEKQAKKLEKRIVELENKLGIVHEEPKRGRKKKM
jgi:hypothetical protein